MHPAISVFTKQVSTRILVSLLLALTTLLSAPTVDAQEIVLKDTFSDTALWSGAILPSEATAFYSDSPSSPQEFRFYVGFQGEGTLDKISFPIFFHDSGVPVPDPSDTPYKLSVKVYQNFAEMASNPLLIDAELDAPLNSDWRDTAFIQDGQTIFNQVWDLSSLNATLVAGEAHYLALAAIVPNGSLSEIPAVPLVVGTGMPIGSEDDFFFFEAATPEPIPVGSILPGSQAAIKLTAISSSKTEETSPPQSFNSFRGTYLEGDLASLSASDNDLLRYNPGFTLNSDESPVWTEFTTVVSDPANTQEMTISLETNTSTPGLSMMVEVFDQQNNNYQIVEALGSHVFGTQTTSITLTNPDYLNAAGELKTRVGFRQTGFTIHFPWTVGYDLVETEFVIGG